MIDVVAALIWNADKFMICQRPAHKTRGLLWEFVGGKVDPGETLEQALFRECQEELDVSVDIHSIFTQVVHQYPDMTIRLTLFNCDILSGEPKKLEHVDIKWISGEEIGEYDFCPADYEFLDQIQEESKKRR